VAEIYGGDDAFFQRIPGPFRAKSRRLESALTGAGFRPLVPRGAYYMLADYRSLGFTSDVEAMESLIQHKHVGAVPGTEFYRKPEEGEEKEETGLLRFCFALVDSELDRGCALLTA
jgi:aminotransferase